MNDMSAGAAHVWAAFACGEHAGAAMCPTY